MPRTLRPRLRRMLERANPNVATFVELSVPDAAKVLRRADDQFFTSPDPLVSMSPAASAVASQAGALTLASVASNLFTQMSDSGTYFFLPQEQGSETFHGTVGWTLASAFTGAVLRAVTVKLRWISPAPPDVALQIYRVHRTAGVLQRQQGSSTVETAAVQHSFVPLLQQPAIRRFKDIGVLFSDVDVAFDLTPYRLEIQPISSPPPGPAESGDLPEYFFEVRPLLQGVGNFVGWVKDTTSTRNINGLGSIREVGWQRKDPNDPASLWVRTDQNYSLCIKVDIEQFVPTSQEIYKIHLPALPSAASVGRIVFDHGTPSGTSIGLDLSTAGSGGPFTPVQNGDVVSVVQQDYHLRLTMNASGDRQHAPVVKALGVEYRSTVDLSPESTLEPMSQGVSVPFLAASVGEGSVTVVRTGRRDYRDLGAIVASQGPDTQLEIDAYVGSRHPAVTRDDWFHTTRAQVSSRTPSGTAESFSLLSLAKTLKRKIPARLESINTVHTVTAATTTQIQVSPVLLGASPTGNEYDGQGYYLRVRQSSQPGVETGQVFLIGGNTGVDKLDFPSNADPTISKELPGTFAVGDQVEVHSGRYQQPAISWVDADPADVWHEILTLHLGVPDDRIGLADVGTRGRSGRPPKVTDRAPGDAATQAKCKVTLKLTDAEDGDALIDQLSFLMGGATIEIAGQLVFRQIYALRDANGNVTVAPDPVVATFDARDYSDLDTPTGREQRITVLACDYGVDTTSAAALPTATATYVDADALASYQLQDVEGLGTAAVPDEIARWCYNSTDFGLFLASQCAQQVVQACSTGVRLWAFTTVDAHPELTVGDTVVVITDKYTDYDPARDAAVKGVLAYPLVLVSTAAGGRRFVGFLQGLAGVVGVDVRGGDGTLQDNNPPPPTVTVILPPTASLDFVSEDDTQVTLALTGVLGAGDTGPLEYSTRLNAGAWSGWSTSHADWSVPRAPKATKMAYLQVRQADGQVSTIADYAVTGNFPQVDPATGLTDGLDASGLVTHPVPLPLAVANIPAIDPTDGHVDPTVTLHGTSHFIPRATDVNGSLMDPNTKDSRSAPLNAMGRYGVDALDGWLDGTYKKPTVAQVGYADRAGVGFNTGGALVSRIMPGVQLLGTTLTVDKLANLSGAQCNLNPDFATGDTSGFVVYDNNSTGQISLSLVADSASPSGSGYKMRVNATYVASPRPTPGMGGFTVAIGPDSGIHTPGTYHRGAELIHRLWVLIPAGWTINFASNAYGTGGSIEMLNSVVGTGVWQLILARQIIGTSGSFSSTGFWYLDDGAGNTYIGGLNWDVGKYDIIDISQSPVSYLGSGLKGQGGSRLADVDVVTANSGSKDSRASLLNTHFRYGTDTAAGVVETAGQKFVNGAALDGSRNVDFGASGVVNRLAANVLRIAGGATMQAVAQQLTDSGHAGSGMQDSRAAPLNTFGRYGTDALDGWLDSASYRKVAASNVDSSGNVIGPTVSISSLIGTANISTNQLTVTFSTSGMPTGTTFNVWYTVDATTTGDGTSGGLDNTSSGHVFSVGNFPSSTPSGSITVDAVNNGHVIATKRRAGPFAL